MAGVLATFTTGCVYRIPAYGVDLCGKAAIGDFYAALFRSFPDFANETVTCYPSTGAVFAEVVTRRTHAGPWGPFPATGRTFESRSLAQFPVADDGLLGGEIVHVNPAHALHEIGALPSADLVQAVAALRPPLAGRVALVFGATGGIGGGLAAALADAGAHVVLAGRDAAALDAAAERISGRGGRAGTVVADLTDVRSAGAAVTATEASEGRLDVLVNAGGGTLRGPALAVTEQTWDAVQALNLKSVFFCCQAAARVMVEQPTGGSIINVASLNSVVGNAWAASYAASKGGVAQLTRSLALEWADRGVRVNAIGPGFIRTSMTEPLLDDESRAGRLLDHIPLGRFGTPDDLGGTAVFLAGDASRYLTGQVIYVDGGYLCV